jgi:hypothetical protein
LDQRKNIEYRLSPKSIIVTKGGLRPDTIGWSRGRTGSFNNNTSTFPYFQVSYRGLRGKEKREKKQPKKQPKHPPKWDKYFSEAQKRLERSVSFAICIGRTILNVIL